MKLGRRIDVYHAQRGVTDEMAKTRAYLTATQLRRAKHKVGRELARRERTPIT